MNPPLGTAEDRQAIIDGIADGTIQAFATDHAPHTKDKKNTGMLNAPFGIVGLETAVGVTYTTLVKNGAMTINNWLKRWTTGPANILGIEQPSLAPGKPANVAVLDLESEWRIDPSKFQSKSHNTPFAGTFITGRSICTLYNGKIVQHP
jgi:dihydroorotase